MKTETEKIKIAGKFDVISPDGFPITLEPFETAAEALEFIPKWCSRFEAQGYYSTNRRERIPISILAERLLLVTTDED